VLVIVAVLCAVGSPPAARGQFTPGNVFVSDPSQKFCNLGDLYGWDRIWEIDPFTGTVTLFAELRDADCGYLTGLVFTPDGCHLRAASLLKRSILEFAPDGSWTVVLDADDGIVSPGPAANCLAYDAQGNFYVANGQTGILRFPADGGPGTVFADFNDGILGDGSMVFASDGDLYFANVDFSSTILRISPVGESFLFKQYDNSRSALSVTANASRQVFVGLRSAGRGIYRFDTPDPDSEMLVASAPDFNISIAITMSVDRDVIFTAVYSTKQLLAVSASDGALAILAEVLNAIQFGLGIAVAPGTLGDLDRDRDSDLVDAALLAAALTGPRTAAAAEAPRPLNATDFDFDGDTDLADVARFQRAFSGMLPTCR